MTDYVTIKRSDIESLQSFDASFEGGVIESEQGQYVLLSDLRAILDKAPSVEQKHVACYTKRYGAQLSKHGMLLDMPDETLLYTSPPQAEARIAELEKDARRYQWLRNHWHGFEYYRKNSVSIVDVEKLDSDIDQAMEKTNESGV